MRLPCAVSRVGASNGDAMMRRSFDGTNTSSKEFFMLRLVHQLKELGFSVPNFGSGMSDSDVLMVTMRLTEDNGTLRYLHEDEFVLNTGHKVYEYDGDCWVLVKDVLSFTPTRVTTEVLSELNNLRERAVGKSWAVVVAVDQLLSRYHRAY